MAQPEPIVIDEAEPIVHALSGLAARLAIVAEDGSVVELSEQATAMVLRAVYVSLSGAGRIIGIPAAAVAKLARQGRLEALQRDADTYVALQDVIDYAREQRAVRAEALAEMFRVTEEGGLYDAERDSS
jgi:hypothetical protein